MATIAGSDNARGRGISSEERFVIFASSLGTVFEWYDFYLYAILAPFFAALFFPPGNEPRRCSGRLPATPRAFSCVRSAPSSSGASVIWWGASTRSSSLLSQQQVRGAGAAGCNGGTRRRVVHGPGLRVVFSHLDPLNRPPYPFPDDRPFAFVW